MLRVTLIGNLGADTEAKYTQAGNLVVAFRVAVNQVRTGADGVREENTEWFRCRVMGKQAEYAQRLGKGSRVLVVGRLDISHYTSRDGEPRTGYDVWTDEVQNLSPRDGQTVRDEDDGSYGAPAPAPGRAPAAAVAPANSAPANSAPVAAGRGRRDEAPSDLEDLPF